MENKLDKEMIEEMAIEDIVKVYPEISRPTAFGIINILKFGYGQSKLPKDSVVLSRKEYEKLNNLKVFSETCGTISTKQLYDYMREFKEGTVRETAEKILNDIKYTVKRNERTMLRNIDGLLAGNKIVESCDINERVDEIAKQYGVEIKE